MEVKLSKISKRFGYNTILKEVDLLIPTQSCIGLSGANGSGKSTLMKIISGYLSPSNGTVDYTLGNKQIPRTDVFHHLTFSAPYISLAELFTLEETLHHNQHFKDLNHQMDYQSFLSKICLPDTKSKYLQDFSSGMKQKVHLALAVLSKSDLILLDEPTSYLDKEAKKWFYDLLSHHIQGRTVVIASNDEEDFDLCRSEIFKLKEGKLV